MNKEYNPASQGDCMFVMYYRPTEKNLISIELFELCGEAVVPTEVVYEGRSIEAGRAEILRRAPGAKNCRRAAGEDPQILETWI